MASTLVSIGKFSFVGYLLLTKIFIPSSVISIGDNAFLKRSSLEQVLFENLSSINSIGKYAFKMCTSLKQIMIPSSVKLIGINAFIGCSMLSQVQFENPSSLTSIEDNVFKECSLLTQISIPSSVTSIGISSFKECSSLEIISIPSSGNMPLISVLNKDSSINFTKCKFTYSTSSYSCMIVGIKWNNAIFDKCEFKDCGEDAVFLGYVNSEASNAGQSEGTFIFTNNEIKGNNGRLIRCDNMVNKPTIENNVFNDITLSDKYLISIIYHNSQIELVSNTFSSIVGSGSSNSGCGGLGVFISNPDTEFSIKYNNCKFYDIQNKHDGKPNSQGGAIQCGFSSNDLKCDIEFRKFEFLGNKAKGHGGALSIRTSKSVSIIECIFTNNIANNIESSSELLYDNNYDLKNKGFGGAIYLNPTFKSDTNEDHCMSSVTISDCTFTDNRAYQGYAIYIEGENGGTTFTINDYNQFINSYHNEETGKEGGIIASEITSINKEFNLLNTLMNSGMMKTMDRIHNHLFILTTQVILFQIQHLFLCLMKSLLSPMISKTTVMKTTTKTRPNRHSSQSIQQTSLISST